jgi:general secretion pathway protein E
MTSSGSPRLPIGQLLLQRNALQPNELASALAVQASAPGDRIGSVLIRMGLISEQTLLQALAEQLDLPVFDTEDHPGLIAAVRGFHEKERISQALAGKCAFFAWRDDAGRLSIAARDPLDSLLLEVLETRIAAGTAYRLLLCPARDLERMLSEVYRPRSDSVGLDQDLRRLAEDAPVVELVNGVLARATDTGASDIHIEPVELGFVVRYRIDGILHSMEQYPRDRFDAVVSRIKLIAGLDISERRLPQDGRFSSRTAGVDTDVRVSVIPGVKGESLVLRLLPNMQGKRFSLDSLGFEPDHLALFKNWMSQPDGIILVTGPTGSGKSTTLYAALSACDTAHERILTVEDPVEYQVEGVTQFQVHADIGFTFPAVLRAILRHDPDTIMIGEIRDPETARIAVQASLTGHRVFSTLHTNDSVTAFLRLSDMGVEPFLVGATVRGVMAQRLVRRLCIHCAEPLEGPVPAQAREDLERQNVPRAQWQFKKPVGCNHCGRTGYRGRTAIYELLPATEALRAALGTASASHVDLMAAAGKDYRSLREDGVLKAARGTTSLEEIFTIAGSGAPD